MNTFNATNEILALDFDGVIVDSIKECLVSGYNAYANLSGGLNIEHYIQLDPIWAARARQMRNYIRNGEDYVFIALALAEDAAIQCQEDFDAFLAKHQHLRDSFVKHMVEQRISFADAHPDSWTQLNPLYRGMRRFLKGYPNKENLYIITTKKLLFVHKILQANDISLIDANVRDTSNGQSKRQIIEDILRTRRVAPQSFHFIDDQVDTLLKIKPTGVNLALAAWGYNNEQQVEKARTSGIEVLELQDFFERFGVIANQEQNR